MDVDRAYVSGLELGQRNPTVITLWYVAKALNVDFREIFGATATGRTHSLASRPTPRRGTRRSSEYGELDAQYRSKAARGGPTKAKKRRPKS
jgi:transcriptional regulator with XRE-family HTH domain